MGDTPRYARTCDLVDLEKTGAPRDRHVSTCTLRYVGDLSQKKRRALILHPASSSISQEHAFLPKTFRKHKPNRQENLELESLPAGIMHQHWIRKKNQLHVSQQLQWQWIFSRTWSEKWKRDSLFRLSKFSLSHGLQVYKFTSLQFKFYRYTKEAFPLWVHLK